MRNVSITAVPPDVSSRPSVALFMFVLSVSQWPTRAFSFSNASAPPPGRACVISGRIPTLSTNAQTIFNKPFIDRFSSHEFFQLAKNRPLESQRLARSCGRFAFPAETLCRESHDRAEKHARNHNVPEQSHPRLDNHQQTQHCCNADSRQNSQQHRMHALRNISGCNSCNQSLQQRKRNDTSHHWRQRRLKETAQSVHQPKHTSHGKAQHGFREAHRFPLRKRASIHCIFIWHSCPLAFRLSLACRGCRCGRSAVP